MKHIYIFGKIIHQQKKKGHVGVIPYRWMDEWMDGWTDRWMDRWMDEWIDGRMDRWMDGSIVYTCIYIYSIYSIYIYIYIY